MIFQNVTADFSSTASGCSPVDAPGLPPKERGDVAELVEIAGEGGHRVAAEARGAVGEAGRLPLGRTLARAGKGELLDPGEQSAGTLLLRARRGRRQLRLFGARRG